MELKKAEKDDLAALLDFAEHSFRVAYEAMNDPAAFQAYCAKAFTPEQFFKEFQDPRSEFWLGELEGKLVAYLKLNFDQHIASVPAGKTVQVERIYLESALQGHGLGVTLMDFVQDQAVRVQAEWIWLSVWKRNPRALKFYERCGYEICGTAIFQLGDDPQTDWVMRKRVFTT